MNWKPSLRVYGRNVNVVKDRFTKTSFVPAKIVPYSLCVASVGKMSTMPPTPSRDLTFKIGESAVPVWPGAGRTARQENS
jgi:hypothetical protein